MAIQVHMRSFGRLASSALLLLSQGSVSQRGASAFASNKHSRSTSLHVISKTALFSTKPSISISDSYDGGNIELIKCDTEDDPKVLLNIKKDPFTELEKKHHFQYFSFRSTVETPSTVEYSIENAGEASYAEAWNEYTVFYTSSLNDPDSWKRNLSTEYKDGKLTWTHEHDGNGSVYFAYFPIYPYSRHLELVEKCSKYAKVETLGQSLGGREIEMITLGLGDRKCWIIHRQHPGEHMAEYFAEGLLTRLLGLDANGAIDGRVHKLLKQYTFYIVPSMCPDGGVMGHLRTNQCGANLNREWADSDGYEAPTLERSPEVYGVLNKMDEVGCDVFCDIHGDEALPFNFLAQAAVPNWGPRLEALHGAFLAEYCRVNPDMQQKYAYDAVPFQEGDTLNIASDQIAARFDCLSVTLEMPFKDCQTNPDPERGWNPARARKLGSSLLDPLAYIHPLLRNESDFWDDLPDKDAYVLPTSEYK